MPRCRRKPPRLCWDPLKDRDGIAYHNDGVTTMDQAKARLFDRVMTVFDSLPKPVRDYINEHDALPPGFQAGRR